MKFFSHSNFKNFLIFLEKIDIQSNALLLNLKQTMDLVRKFFSILNPYEQQPWPKDLWLELFSVEDVAFNVCKFLPPKDFVKLSIGNKQLYEILNSEDSWQNLTENQLGIFEKKEKNKKKLSWKQIYQLILSDQWIRKGDTFGGAWYGDYWKREGEIYNLTQGLWWFSCGTKFENLTLPPGDYFGYWCLMNGTREWYDFILEFNGSKKTVKLKDFIRNKWIVIRIGPFTAGNEKNSTAGWIENIESSYKQPAFKIKYLKIVPWFGSDIAEKEMKITQKINEECTIFEKIYFK